MPNRQHQEIGAAILWSISQSLHDPGKGLGLSMLRAPVCCGGNRDGINQSIGLSRTNVLEGDADQAPPHARGIEFAEPRCGGQRQLSMSSADRLLKRAGGNPLVTLQRAAEGRTTASLKEQAV
jgi:hypothetical protein